MVEIYLARHGQSRANAEGIIAGHIDSPLNEIGRQQARELVELINKAGLKFDYIYVSPLIRAKETAQIISEGTGSPDPVVMNELIERDFGILTGKTYEDIPRLATELLEADKIGYFRKRFGKSEVITQKRKCTASGAWRYRYDAFFGFSQNSLERNLAAFSFWQLRAFTFARRRQAQTARL
jgi:broad specificity phosphatase PhoE